ncbi:MAG: hypothetical protein HS117_12690 [Verrucomicrobiaceae bacterium]|nr:hypothetical protein [Verrucomicrobiaceae bacterium]
MQSNTQSAARAFVWNLLSANIEGIVKRAQEQKYAHEVGEALWLNPAPADLQRLDDADSTYLLKPNGFSNDLKPWIIKALCDQVHPESPEAKSNRELRGGGLKKTCEWVVTRHWDDVRRCLDDLFEKRERDCFADRLSVRTLVIQEINDRCFDELDAGTMNENDRKLRLKMLVILAWQQEHPDDRRNRILNLRHGWISELPFVPKYIGRGTLPKNAQAPSFQPVQLNQVFTSEVLSKFPEAKPIQLCVERFFNRTGLMSVFSDPNRPITEDNASAYAALGPEVQTRSGIISSKEAVLYNHRRDSSRMPDGVVALVGMSVLLESLLRQILNALGSPSNRNHRGYKLANEVGVAVVLSTQTTNLLKWVFGSSNEAGRRDSIAHGVFPAANHLVVEDELKALTATFNLLLNELTPDQRHDVFAHPHWNTASQIDASDLAIFDTQSAQLNLLRQPDLEAARRHVFAVLTQIIPDKAQLGKSVILFWVNLEGSGARLAGDEGAEFAGIVGAMLVFEELLRAINEIKCEPILNVFSQMLKSGDGLVKGFKCEFAFLDESDGQLLESSRMERLFPRLWAIPEFRDSLRVVREVRDRVLHGGWHLLPVPRNRFLHLMIKLIFACCEDVEPTDPSR